MRIIVPALVAVALPVLLTAYMDGPPPNMTGGFGEPSCHSCHLDKPVNAPGGWLVLSGPTTYEPGRAYRITINLTREGLSRGGFEISARFSAGNQKGKQAGTWRALDARVQIVASEGDRL